MLLTVGLQTDLPCSKLTDQADILGDSGRDNVDAGDDFLARERAALGDDADQFATPEDQAAVSTKVEDEEEDLLGGPSTNEAGGVDAEFESSFPAIDTSNEVSQIYRTPAPIRKAYALY